MEIRDPGLCSDPPALKRCNCRGECHTSWHVPALKQPVDITPMVYIPCTGSIYGTDREGPLSEKPLIIDSDAPLATQGDNYIPGSQFPEGGERLFSRLIRA